MFRLRESMPFMRKAEVHESLVVLFQRGDQLKGITSRTHDSVQDACFGVRSLNLWRLFARDGRVLDSPALCGPRAYWCCVSRAPAGEVAEVRSRMAVGDGVFRKTKNPPAGCILGGGSLTYSASIQLLVRCCQPPIAKGHVCATSTTAKVLSRPLEMILHEDEAKADSELCHQQISRRENQLACHHAPVAGRLRCIASAVTSVYLRPAPVLNSTTRSSGFR